MSDNVVPIPTSAITPQALIETLSRDAERMSAMIVMIKMEDGSWHLRHSTMPTSTLELASIKLVKEIVRIA